LKYLILLNVFFRFQGTAKTASSSRHAHGGEESQMPGTRGCEKILPPFYQTKYLYRVDQRSQKFLYYMTPTSLNIFLFQVIFKFKHNFRKATTLDYILHQFWFLKPNCVSIGPTHSRTSTSWRSATHPTWVTKKLLVSIGWRVALFNVFLLKLMDSLTFSKFSLNSNFTDNAKKNETFTICRLLL
jgi:hypothetical protein